MTLQSPRRRRSRRRLKLRPIQILVVAIFSTIIGVQVYVFSLLSVSTSEKRNLASSITPSVYLDPDGLRNSTGIKSHPLVQRKWAYVFLMGGVNPIFKDHFGTLFNILIAAHLLQESGSVADVVVLIQLSTSTPFTELPPEETKLFDSLNIKYKYIPKSPKKESF
jgi:hypothetical protein